MKGLLRERDLVATGGVPLRSPARVFSCALEPAPDSGRGPGRLAAQSAAMPYGGLDELDRLSWTWIVSFTTPTSNPAVTSTASLTFFLR